MIIIEAIGLLVKTIWMLLSELCIALIDCIPVFIELKQVFSHCTFAGAWALFLGVPPIAITILHKALVHQK